MKKIVIEEQDINALQDTIYVIGGKWKLPIIYSICNGNKRFMDIERSIPGLTTRMLARNLKELEDNKLISRIMNADIGVAEYEFTEYAKEYGTLIMNLIAWGKKHRAMIIESIR
ncbi:helix-turn-helix domain-containing protein [Sphingobacterium sp. JUb56]|uniref:winged helix-turn-helix transcriptional regulator n=1 Tax=Sphingobacterium sp. JUb56 TaxID=2587145 RepID=UPI0016151B57|nr:helix-turn-helix domain-containing protein [Sphingobacterium sp. JUb56]MBB2950664.1 DNA-binding HxlR family transcriptional regulator [Sphingobacterium sp. JUb56]